MADTWDDNTDMDMYYSDEEEDEVLEFLSLPKLEGIETFAAWDSALRNYMRKGGLLKHIDGSAAEPKAGLWQPIGRTPTDDEAEGIISLIIDTISPKFNYLLRPRWLPWNVTQPRDFYLFVRRLTWSGFLPFLPEYAALQRGDFTSLGAFLDRLLQLRRLLVKNGLSADDMLHVSVALDALKQSYPTECEFWKRSANRQALSWNGLVDQMARMATEEDETEAGLVAQMTNMDLSGAGAGDDSSATQTNRDETEEAGNDNAEDMEADLVDKVARLELDAGDDSDPGPDMDMDMDIDDY
ncbi:hypothetical protein B0T24DRAFT_720663 [Lasiosphaeria ovina]|uniref:Uncharacterized protein n=1 Tax=Lasiosphaeria ovina TaxID=92902 RepID=A0AAE0KCE8_9PEZI|nr:hypothetical protein B0T24DRAFT_720663 [Lasiosphaeria ovina]